MIKPTIAKALRLVLVPAFIVFPLLVSDARGASNRVSSETQSAINNALAHDINDQRPFFRLDAAGIWPTHNIRVCWTNSTIYADEQRWVRDAISKFIERNSDYRFAAAWSVCDSESRAEIRIEVNERTPATDVGYKLPSKYTAFPTYLGLNFLFQKWGQGCQSTKQVEEGISYRQRCIETIAVHEFLHALGALHEQLDPDLRTKDPGCWELYKDSISTDVQGLNPVRLTPYDPDSIMNYCHEIYSRPTQLSERDLAGLRLMGAMTLEKERIRRNG